MPVSAAHDDGLQARMQQLERSNDRSDERYNERMQQLERSNERLQLALSGVREREEATREREEAARREVVELIAREEALSQRLAAIEARLAGGGIGGLSIVAPPALRLVRRSPLARPSPTPVVCRFPKR